VPRGDPAYRRARNLSRVDQISADRHNVCTISTFANHTTTSGEQQWYFPVACYQQFPDIFGWLCHEHILGVGNLASQSLGCTKL
jgi:hypothetical protein